MGTRTDLTKHKARKKGLYAGLGAAGTALMFFLGWPIWLGLAGAGGTAYLTYQWLKFRGKWGMRF